MHVYEIRKRNLLVLLEAEKKSLKVIADAMVAVVQRKDPARDRAPDYQNVLSKHKGGKRMGYKVARLMEEAMGKPEGWMDRLQEAEIEASMQSKEAAQLADNMTEEKRELWLQLGRTFAQENPKRSAGNPFGDIPRGGARPNR